MSRSLQLILEVFLYDFGWIRFLFRVAILDFFDISLDISLTGKDFMCIFAKSRYNDSLWEVSHYITVQQKSSKSQF